MIFHTLTAVLIVLKLIGLITIGWFLVLLPSIISFSLVLLILIIGGIFVLWSTK